MIGFRKLGLVPFQALHVMCSPFNDDFFWIKCCDDFTKLSWISFQAVHAACFLVTRRGLASGKEKPAQYSRC